MAGGYVYVCRGCAAPPRRERWDGQPCPNCHGYWSIMGRRASDFDSSKGRVKIDDGERVVVCDEEGQVEDVVRYRAGGDFRDVDRLFADGDEGGPSGFVAGSVTLLAGPPGIGKSTLTLQLAQRLAFSERVLLALGEESVDKVLRRNRRLGIKPTPKLEAVREKNLDQVIWQVEDQRAKIVIVDSVQSLEVDSEYADYPLAPGSTHAIATALKQITDYAAREDEVAWILIGHVTADGSISGPHSGLLHAVDCVLYFDGEKGKTRRVLRAEKNRFGSTGPEARCEFDMTAKGLVPVEPAERAA